MKGFQIGNDYARSRRTVENRLRIAAHRYVSTLDKALERAIIDAAEHESPTHRMACLSWIADRLDGRARQSVEVSQGDSPRELELADLVRLVLDSRKASASDADTIDQVDQQPASPDTP